MKPQTIVSDPLQLREALQSGAAHILCKDFTTEPAIGRMTVDHPVVIDGGGAAVDFGFEILSGGVELRNFHIHTSRFEQAVSAPGKNGGPGDCIAVEIHSAKANGDLPVIVTGLTIVHDIFDHKNSAIYLGDGSYVEIYGNDITVENKQGNAYERGGIFVGAGVRGRIADNRIDAARTGFPMSPIGLRASLDHLTGPLELSPVEIIGNTVETTYASKIYVSGAWFGADDLLLEEEADFGVRAALRELVLRLERQNRFTLKSGCPAAGEGAYVQCRLDLIFAGAPYYEKNVFFDIHDGCPVRTPRPTEQ